MNKTVLITGASSGIGKACALHFAANNYNLILTGRRKNNLKEIADEIKKSYSVELSICCFDVRDKAEMENALTGLGEQKLKMIDVLINNAGLAKGLDWFEEADIQHWETMIDTNIKGLLYISRFIAPYMVAKSRGHIINVGSIAGKEVYPKGAVYCASKFAVDALTKGMRMDLHHKGIRVSQVSPGHVEETEFAKVRFDGDVEKAKIYNDFQPLKASDVADAIFYMASRPPHVNVQDILIMGSQQASATIIDRSGRNL
jgi:NADP-dependent 3-hydroxy acid dehydrogenase YdfG